MLRGCRGEFDITGMLLFVAVVLLILQVEHFSVAGMFDAVALLACFSCISGVLLVSCECFACVLLLCRQCMANVRLTNS